MTAIAAPGGLWLRGRTFDTGFILGTAATALLAGYAVARNNSLFLPVLVFDLWLLGYHHVIATFTQIAFDAASVRQHRFLVLGLPPLVVLGTFALAAIFGLAAVVSLYLYWQWFHYTRQSYGVFAGVRQEIVAAARRCPPDEDGPLSAAALGDPPSVRTGPCQILKAGGLGSADSRGTCGRSRRLRRRGLRLLGDRKNSRLARRTAPPRPHSVPPLTFHRFLRRLHRDREHRLRLVDHQHLAQRSIHSLCLAGKQSEV
jgi:hypothetical protein